MQKTLIFSDIHFGDKRLSSLHLLHNLLLTETYDRLILNGDIIDLWLSNCMEIFKSGFLSFIEQIAKIKEVIWIIGNHDYKIMCECFKSKMPSVKVAEFFEMIDGGKKFLFLHGNQVYNQKDQSFFAKFTSKLNYFVWKKFNIDIQEKINDTKYYLKYANKKREKIIKIYGHDVDIIISGHTHNIGHIIFNGIELFDLGAFIKQNSYAIIENGILKMEEKNG